MYHDNFAGGLDPTVIQFMSYFRPALRGACSLLNIATDNGFTEKNKRFNEIVYIDLVYYI